MFFCFYVLLICDKYICVLLRARKQCKIIGYFNKQSAALQYTNSLFVFEVMLLKVLKRRYTLRQTLRCS